jgi:hypothetical protein
MDATALRHREPIASDTCEELTPLHLVSPHLRLRAIDDSIDRLEMCTLSIVDDVMSCHDYDVVAALAGATHLLVHLCATENDTPLHQTRRINPNGPLLFLPCMQLLR